jgi:hypothetical protein
MPRDDTAPGAAHVPPGVDAVSNGAVPPEVIADRLDHHWDRAVRGHGANTADGDALDGPRAETVARLQALAPIGLDAARRARILAATVALAGEPLAEPTIDHGAVSAGARPTRTRDGGTRMSAATSAVPNASQRRPHPTPPLVGAAAPPLAPLAPRSSRAPRSGRLGTRRWWPPLELAAAVLLIAGLLGGALAGTAGLPGLNGSQGDLGATPTATAPDTSATATSAVERPSLTLEPWSGGRLADGGYDVAAGGPVDVILRRVTLQPGASWNYRFAGTALHYVETGSVSVALADSDQATPVPAGSVATGEGNAASGDGLLMLANTGDGAAVVTQALVYSGLGDDEAWGAATLLAGGEVTVQPLAYAPGLDLPDTGELTLIRQNIDGPGGGGGTTLNGTAEVITLEQGRLYLARTQGEVLIGRGTRGATDGASSRAARELPPVLQETLVETGDSVVALPGGGYDVRNPDEETAFITILSLGPSEPPVAAAGTPPTVPTGTPAVPLPGQEGETVLTPGPELCRVEPRTVDELRALAAGTPVPFEDLSLREIADTGVPADPTTSAAVTAAIAEFAACAGTGHNLRTFALLTDDGLRAIVGGIAPEELGYYLATPTPDNQPSGSPPTLVIADIRVFPDGRAGARVSFGGELAYVTLAEEADGWRIAAFDDRGAEEIPLPATPIP